MKEKHTDAPLRELAAGSLWVKETRPRFLGLVEVGGRMTVVRLADGALLLHSPVRLDGRMRAELDALGPVRFALSPNKLHHLFIGDYAAAYPQARIYAAPGLAKRRRDLSFHGDLTDIAERAWADDLDQVIVKGHPWLQEVVFFHRQSRTLIVADMLQNFHEESPFLTRVYARLDGCTSGRATRWTFASRRRTGEPRASQSRGFSGGTLTASFLRMAG